MNFRPSWLANTLLVVLPSLLLVIGASLGLLAVHRSASSDPLGLQNAIIVAVAAPLLAACTLVVVVPGFDAPLFASAAMLTAIGMTVVVLLGAGSGLDRAFYGEIGARHGLFIGAGFLALTLGAIGARFVDRLAAYPASLLLLSLLMTAATVLFGETANGARLWLRLGPIRFQPSEVSRLLLAAFVAIYLYDRRHLVASAWRVGRYDLPPAPYLLPLVAAAAAAVGVLVLQNDLGMAALVVLGALASLLSVQSSRPFVAVSAALIGLAGAISYMLASRVQDRVAGWLDPWGDPMQRGFQFIQAEYGLAAGGAAGHVSTATATRVPEVHTDLVLAGIGSQFGLLGALATVGLAGILVCRCVLVALRASDGLRALLAFGIAALLGVQILLIAGGTLRIVPLTGLTFPLVSYGGTSMIVTLFAIGVLVGIDARAGTKALAGSLGRSGRSWRPRETPGAG